MKSFSQYAENRHVNLNDKNLFESESLYNEMALLNPNAISKTQNAFQFISENQIPGVLIGGMAVAHYTADRPLTPDVDLLVDHIDKIKQLLNSKNMVFQPLASTGAFGGIFVPEIDADFIDANEGNVNFNHYILRTAIPGKIGGIIFKIIDPAVLTIMKFIVGRQKDTEDAFKLLPKVSKSALKTHLSAVKNWLGSEIDAQTIWSYAKNLTV